nr:ribonuclease H-like domain-containing protein [Tanacetum cinerariifolium]
MVCLVQYNKESTTKIFIIVDLLVFYHKENQRRVLVIKPYNKTPYELFHGRIPSLSFMRPFGCPVTILNTQDPLGSGPTWLFDIDTLTKSMNYKPVAAGNQSNDSACKDRDFPGDGFKPLGDEKKKDAKDLKNEYYEDNVVDENIVYRCVDDLNMPNLENMVYSDDDEDVSAEADMT